MTTNAMTHKLLEKKALEIRKTMVKMLAPGESHHIGCSLSIVDILTVLYFSILKVDPQHPRDRNRDFFILSKGHAGAAVYATLYERGFFSRKFLDGYDRDNGTLMEHITTLVPGVEFSTGSLGHGLPVASGIAYSLKKDGKKNKVYVLLSDGELEEGSNWEAFLFAARHKLDNLIVLVDRNTFQGYGTTEEILGLESIAAKLHAFHWNIYECNGHDIAKLMQTFKNISLSKANKPHFIIAKTIKGKGVSFFEGKFESHYESIDEEQQKAFLSELNNTEA